MVNLNRRHFLAAGIGAAAVVGLSACSQSTGTSSSPSASSSAASALPSTDWVRADAAAVKDGGTLRLAVLQVPDNWNSDQTNGNLADLTTVRGPMGYSQAVKLSETGELSINPDYLVKAELTSEDPQVVSVQFNPKAVWEDGTPITISDLKAYAKALSGKDKKYELVSTLGWEDISEVKQTTDEFTGEIHFSKVYPDWMGQVYPNLPESISSDVDKFNKGYVSKPTPSQGPYKVKKYDKDGGTIELERNDKWWGTKPKLDTILFKATTQENQPSSFANSELDVIETSTGDAYATAKARSDAMMKKSNGLTWTHLTINTKNVADAAVRMAIAYGINRELIGQAIVGPLETPVVTVNNLIFMPGQTGYEDSWGVTYDKDKAAKLLADAGYVAGSDKILAKDGKQLKYSIVVPAGTQTNIDRALQTQKDLNALGFSVELETVDSNAYFEEYVLVKNFDLVTFSWVGGTFAISGGVNLFTTDSGQNFMNYSSTTADQLAKDANGTLDQAVRISKANEFSKTVLGDTPIIPFYATPIVWALKNDIVNYGPSQFESVDWTIVGFKA